MYSLAKSEGRRRREDDDKDSPPAQPYRKSEAKYTPGYSSVARNEGGVAHTQVAKRSDTGGEHEGPYTRSNQGMTRTSDKAGAAAAAAGTSQEVGAIAVPGINASSTTESASSTYRYSSSVNQTSPIQEETQVSEVANQDAIADDLDTPLEATRVEDDEADIEAQVQARMEDQAKDIANMVHQNLVKNMAVPVDVQASGGGDASMITTDPGDSSKRSSEEDAKKRRVIILVAVGFFVLVAAVGAGVGVALSKKEPPPPTTTNEKCSFCHNGFVPSNFDDDTVLGEGNRTCAEFYDRQVSLASTDQRCAYGQAIAWISCECPTLPPPPEDPKCKLCDDGSSPTGVAVTGVSCADIDVFLSHTAGTLADCDRLKQITFDEFGCTCGDAPPPATSSFKSILAPLSGNALEDTNSPQYKALDWIENTDAANLSPQTASPGVIRTRYVAALLYIALGGFDGGWSNRYKFMTEQDVCNWNENSLTGFKFGITCDSNNVATLRLPENNLRGALPNEIGYLSTLQHIDLTNNTITGAFPSSFANLTRLETLNVTGNAMSGGLPEILFTSTTLVDIFLDDNRFTGTLSPSLGLSSALRIFSVRGSELTGSIPINVGKSAALRSFSAHGNKLTGTIPEFSSNSLWDFLVGDNKLVGSVPRALPTSLYKFSASNNELRGSIPSEFGQCTFLQHLFLHNNTFMTGSIPSQIGGLNFLESLHLYSNQFSGSIPTQLASLRRLEELIIRVNKLTGSIPNFSSAVSLRYTDFAGNLLTGNIDQVIDALPPTLASFDVSQNDMNGTLPASVGKLTNLEWFDVENNNITGALPSELGSLTALTVLWLGWNGFTGSVPQTFASLSSLARLGIEGNELTGSLGHVCTIPSLQFFVANTCLEPNEIECTCCTHCCRVDVDQCLPV